MRRATACLVLAILCVCGSALQSRGRNFQWHDSVMDFMCTRDDTCLSPSDDWIQVKQKFVKRIYDLCQEALKDKQSMVTMMKWLPFAKPAHKEFLSALDTEKTFLDYAEQLASKYSSEEAKARRVESDYKPLGLSKYPYWAWIPMFQSYVVPGGASASWSNNCFSSTSASATYNAALSQIQVTITTATPASASCADLYLLSDLHQIQLQLIGQAAAHTFVLNTTTMSSNELHDVLTRGVRVFRFRDDVIQTVIDILETLGMFLEPLLEASVSEQARLANKDFLSLYQQIQPTMSNRTTWRVDVDESYIQSGDFLGIIRLDGLDPMLAWAMGSTTGHTTVAMRAPNGTLFVCESTATTSYWVVNGIQCTPYKQWVDQCEKASMQVVIAPLSKENRAKFNESQAWQYFYQNQGFDYGFHTMLWGWVDTVSQNYPCVAPDYTTCLTWEAVEVLFTVIDRLAPSVGDLLFRESLAKRAGASTKASFVDILSGWIAQGNAPNTLPTPVEEDKWLYNTTRYGQPAVGKATVCCVFVCMMWKSGGLFDGIDVECGEQTNYDIYSLALFDESRMGDNRPQVCKDADPANPLCQILGKDTLYLNGLNTRTPYTHMDETCPSEAPKYDRPAGC